MNSGKIRFICPRNLVGNINNISTVQICSLLLRGGHEDDLLLVRGARRAHAPADLLAAAVLRRARQHDVAQGDGRQVDTKNIKIP